MPLFFKCLLSRHFTLLKPTTTTHLFEPFVFPLPLKAITEIVKETAAMPSGFITTHHTHDTLHLFTFTATAFFISFEHITQ